MERILMTVDAIRAVEKQVKEAPTPIDAIDAHDRLHTLLVVLVEECELELDKFLYNKNKAA